MSENRTVLVTGATGAQGGAVARELLKLGYTVKAMTRKTDSEQAKELAALGAEIVFGDLDNAESLENALNGAWGTFAVQNTWEAGAEQEEAQGKRFAEIAKKCGIKHFVYTSVSSAQHKTGIPHFDNKWRIEETIRGLGFDSFTIIRPVFFMNNFLSAWFKPGIDTGNLYMSIKPTTPLQMVAVSDIGKYGAMAFDNYKALNGKAIDFAGDSLTMPQVAEIISKFAGKPVQHIQPPIEDIRKMSMDYAIMLEWFDSTGYSVNIDGVAQETGIAPTKFEDFAANSNWA
ncbi:MAG: NmrA family protein [Ignavibacteria bacterium]|nr:NmrA family protein [Ignavibacteria bacterium]